MTSIDQMRQIPVLLSIRGEQYFDDADPEATELLTEGTLEVTDGGLLFYYDETELTGMEGTKTTFSLDRDVVMLTRSGAVNSQMVFQEGQQHSSL